MSLAGFSDFDKTTNRTHRKNVARDAFFYEARKARREALAGSTAAGTSVCINPPPPLSSTTITSTHTAPSSAAPAPAPILPKRRTRCSPWYAVNDPHTVNRWHKHHVPATWRELSFPAVIQELADTIFAQGFPVAITARLRHDFEAKALDGRSTMKWLQQRVADQLRVSQRAGKLSAFPEFMLIIEQVRGRGTHLHGFVEAPAHELEAIRKAFRLACGEYPKDKARQHQVKTDADPDDGWTSYILKDRTKTYRLFRKMMLGAGSSMGVSFKGRPYTATQELRRRAQVAYEADRAAFVACGY